MCCYLMASLMAWHFFCCLTFQIDMMENLLWYEIMRAGLWSEQEIERKTTMETNEENSESELTRTTISSSSNTHIHWIFLRTEKQCEKRKFNEDWRREWIMFKWAWVNGNEEKLIEIKSYKRKFICMNACVYARV